MTSAAHEARVTSRRRRPCRRALGRVNLSSGGDGLGLVLKAVREGDLADAHAVRESGHRAACYAAGGAPSRRDTCSVALRTSRAVCVLLLEVWSRRAETLRHAPPRGESRLVHANIVVLVSGRRPGITGIPRGRRTADVTLHSLFDAWMKRIERCSSRLRQSARRILEVGDLLTRLSACMAELLLERVALGVQPRDTRDLQCRALHLPSAAPRCRARNAVLADCVASRTSGLSWRSGGDAATTAGARFLLRRGLPSARVGADADG